MRNTCTCVALLLVALSSGKGRAEPTLTGQENLVSNAGFEQGTEGWRWVNSRNALASGNVDTATSHTGKASYRITNASALSPYVYCQICQELKAKPNTTYQISAWCKGLGASWVRLQADPKWTFVRPAPEGDFDWVHLSGTYTAGSEQGTLPVMLHVESETKAVWVDDVEVVELSQAQKHARFYVRPTEKDSSPANRSAGAHTDKKPQRGSTRRMILDKPVGTIYDHRDSVVGRYLELANEPLPERDLSFTAMLDQGKIMSLGQISLPKAEAGAVQQFDFVIPAGLLEQEGRYVLSVSTSKNRTGAEPAVTNAAGNSGEIAAPLLQQATVSVIRTNLGTRVRTKTEELTARTHRLQQRLKGEPQFAKDAYVGMGVPLAQRFIAHVKAGGWDGKQSLDWAMMQLEEVQWVLDQTDKRLERLANGQVQVWEQVRVQPGTLRVQDGVFYAKPVGSETNRPFYFGGYDEWDKLLIDLDFLRAVGMNIVQQEAWPKLMKQDGTLEYLGAPSATGPQILPRNIDTFADKGVLVDVILNLHTVPGWLGGQIPGMYEVVGPGWIQYNVDHPEVRQFLTRWIDLLVSQVKDKPGLFGFCLTNEPSYSNSGRDKYSRPKWIAFLKRQHHTVQNLNDLYQQNYKSLDDVPVPPLPKSVGELPKDTPALRAYYDWVTFNNRNFADFHQWVHEHVKRVAPNARTHAKITPYFFSREAVFSGIDPELITNITDLAGNDSFDGKWAWTPGGEFAFRWQEEMAWYELLHAFGGKPVFNSENHLIDTDLPPIHIPPGHTRTEVWQAALHHLWASVVWTWEVFPPYEPATIYRRPANIYAAGQATFDLNRLAKEALTIANQPAEIAILYSMSSVFWSEDCSSLMAPLVVAGSFLGKPVTFVSERQLAEGKLPKEVKWIILPHATHVATSTVEALGRFVDNGGRVVRAGDRCLAWDEYHRERTLPEWVDRAPLLTLPASEKHIGAQLRAVLQKNGMEMVSLIEVKSSQPAWGAEYRVVPDGNRTLVSLLNLLNEPLSVRLEMKGTVIDLLNSASVDLSCIPLDSMSPRLLEIRP